jgi:hypothetical protein
MATRCLLGLKARLARSNAEGDLEGGEMPQIIVTAENPRSTGERAVMFTERVSVSDFESDHFQAQLVERLGWAVGDADALEQQRPQLPDGAELQELEPTEEQHKIGPAPAPGVLVRPSWTPT